MQYPKVKMRSFGLLSLFAGLLLASSPPVYAANTVVVIPMGGGGSATGDAVAADVRAGKTFSNASDNGVAGTMPDNGPVWITPSDSNQSIAAGYHNGAGSVAGDADLVEENIHAGITIFGVTGNFTGGGTYISSAVQQTGQITSYDTNTPQADDGALQRGAFWTADTRFTDNSDGTVTDNLTGLMWLKDANCIKTNYPGFDMDPDDTPVTDPPTPPYACPGPEDPDGCGNGRVYWQHALDFVAGVNDDTYPLCNSTVAAYGDWRLANRFELESLLDLEESDPPLPQGHPFDNLEQLIYWSSSTFDSNHNESWGVHFQHATVHHQQKNNNPHFLMLVREGQ